MPALAKWNLLWLMACLLVLTSDLSDAYQKYVILYTQREPILPKLPQDCCLWLPLEGFAPSRYRAQTVIVAGHGLPPYFANHEVRHLAQAVAALKPELIVMNSCYGASSDLMRAFLDQGMNAYVVAAPFRIYFPGFDYGAGFLDSRSSLRQKILAIQTDPPYPLLRWKLDAQALRSLENQIHAMPPKELLNKLQRVDPPLARMPFPSDFEPRSEMLIPIPVARFQ